MDPKVFDMAIFDHTARKPNVRLEAMAVRKPIQLKESSPADARPTPRMMGMRESMAGMGVCSNENVVGEQAHNTDELNDNLQTLRG